MRRRRLFSGLAASLAAASGLGATSRAEGGGFDEFAEELRSSRDEPAIWNRVRREFLLNPGLIHLNTGTLGATPRKVLDAVSGWLYQLEGDPASNVFGPMGHRMEEVRVKAARFLGASLDEVALVENTTSGMNHVALGLANGLKPGQEILTTDHEHPGGLVCWEYLAKHRGVKLVKIPMPAPVRDKAQILQLIEDHITPLTRVCSFSHVETITGLQMPLAEISRMTRPREILLVCDGAQAPGMLKVDVKSLGVDAYASSSHKWMLAPKGSGLLYVRKEAQDRIRPLALSSGFQSYTSASGTRNVCQILGHGLAMEFHEALGRDRIEDRCRTLSHLLRDKLSELPGLKLLTPTQPELSTGIVSFGMGNSKNSEVHDRLRMDYDIVVKVVAKAEYNGLRFSTHVYNREEDLERAAKAIARLIRA